MTRSATQTQAQPAPDFDAVAGSAVFSQVVGIMEQLTGLPLSVWDVSGERFILPCPWGNLNPFCQIIQESKSGRAACQHSDVTNMSAAAERARFYRCHAGLTDVAAPVILQGKHVATVFTGQVLTAPPTERGFRSVLKKLAGLPVDPDRLRPAYFGTRVVSERQLRDSVRIIALFAERMGETEWGSSLLQGRGENAAIRAARAWMREHYADEIGLADAAKAVGLSVTHFSRVFSREVGEGFVTHLQRIRIENAKRHLLCTEDPVTQIALRCGFNSPTHFDRVFRAIEGTTPSQFRLRACGVLESGDESAAGA